MMKVSPCLSWTNVVDNTCPWMTETAVNIKVGTHSTIIMITVGARPLSSLTVLSEPAAIRPRNTLIVTTDRLNRQSNITRNVLKKRNRNKT